MELLIIYILANIILGVHYAGHRKEYEGRLNFVQFIPLAIAAASSIYQGIKGAKQKREAARLQADADRQEKENLLQARRMALVGMPEAEYQKQLQNIYRNQSVALGALKDRRSALTGATTVQQATNDATANLAAQDAQMRREAERTVLGQANRAASLKGQEAAYQREYGQALSGAAMQNFFNAAGAGAQMMGGGGDGGMGQSNNFLSGMKPLDSSLYGKKGYKGGLGLNYSKPY